MTNPWLDPLVAQQQRALVDRQLAEKPWPPHFQALASAVRATQCPGDILLIGAGIGHEREVLDRAGVEYRSFAGVDISPQAIALARERYPESQWETCEESDDLADCKADVVIDGCALMHVEDWRAHLAALCRASRRWMILHRVPVMYGSYLGGARSQPTQGYGHEFPAHEFVFDDLCAEMKACGFALTNNLSADGNSRTLVFAKTRHWATYCDSAYLPRLKALHASMVRHCGPFELHVLAWDDGVANWCTENDFPHQHVDSFFAKHPELGFGELPGPPRTKVELMWTAGPRWIADVMERTGEPVTYCDSDVMLFSSPEPVFAEIGGAPAAVVPHGFASASQGLPGPTWQTHQVFGEFNVNFVYAADAHFPKMWAKQTREWCYDRVEQVTNEDWTLKYGDQKYLEKWREGGAHVIRHPGAAPGPWCVHTRALDVRDGVIHFGNRPLIAYHFSGYREGPHGIEQLSRPEYAISERQGEIIYTPYIRALRELGK